MLTYGSYLGAEIDIPQSTMVITFAELSVAGFAGLVIFPIVFSFGLKFTMYTELADRTLPRTFAAMPFRRVVGIAFFGALFVAAITPTVSKLEAGVAAESRTTRLGRTRAHVVITEVLHLVGFPSALS